MTTTIHHLRAALRSGAHYRHELLANRLDRPAEFEGAKSGVSENPDAMAALAGCERRGDPLAGMIEEVYCSTVIDAMGDGAILRCITTPKDAPSAAPDAFQALCQSWSLDMQMALDMELAFPGQSPWYGFIVIECTAPYATALYTPDATFIKSGQAKLSKALAVIRNADTSPPAAYPGVQILHVPAWREKELENEPQNHS